MNEICADFVYFKRLLAEARKLDDNLNHRLNGMKIPWIECIGLEKELKSNFENRKLEIIKCIEYSKNKEKEHKSTNGDFVHRKEISLLESELIIEDILQDKSWKLFNNKCRENNNFNNKK